MIPGRLTHNEPKLNNKEFWYVAIAEGPLHYLVEIHSKAGCINGQIRSALKKDYSFVDEPVVEPTPRKEQKFDMSGAIPMQKFEKPMAKQIEDLF